MDHWEYRLKRKRTWVHENQLVDINDGRPTPDLKKGDKFRLRPDWWKRYGWDPMQAGDYGAPDTGYHSYCGSMFTETGEMKPASLGEQTVLYAYLSRGIHYVSFRPDGAIYYITILVSDMDFGPPEPLKAGDTAYYAGPEDHYLKPGVAYVIMELVSSTTPRRAIVGCPDPIGRMDMTKPDDPVDVYVFQIPGSVDARYCDVKYASRVAVIPPPKPVPKIKPPPNPWISKIRIKL